MTPRPGRKALVHAAAALLAGVVADAQRPTPAEKSVDASRLSPEYVEVRLGEWRAATRAHAGGEFDGPAASIAQWPPDLTRLVVDRAIQQRDQQRIRGVIDADKATIAQGLILHTDIAVAERANETGTSGYRAVQLLDARPVSSLAFSIHWNLARQLAIAAARDPDGVPLARAWYRATGALYQQWADLGMLRAHLDDGIDRFTDDAVLWLYAGTLHQALADARVQSYLNDARLSGRTRVVVLGGPRIDEVDLELRHAERTLRRAAAIDPSLVEARIRLAHVLSGRAKPAEAAPLAREALAAPLSPFLEYYAAMVLGRIETQLGERAEARTAFARAAARYPNSQATQVALSQLGVLEGRPADGVAAMMQALGPGAVPGIEDPWSQYFRLHEPDAKSLLDALRRLAP